MAWQSLTAAFALFAAGGALAQVNPTLQAEIAEVANLSEAEILYLEIDRYRRLTVPVTIGNEGPFRFMIDTGAQATVLSRSLADRLHLHDRATATLVGMASTKQVETAAVADVGLGSRRFYIHNAPVVEAANIGDADGILGVDSLQNQRVLLDFDKRQIAVADADDLGGNHGYEIIVRARERLGQLIITVARLNGIKVAVVVDTGASGSIGNLALLRRLRSARRVGQVELTDINGEGLSGSLRIADELRIGNASIEGFPIFFADSPPFHRLGLDDDPALLLGISELKLFRRVAIDFKSRRVLFDMPQRTRFSGRRLATLNP